MASYISRHIQCIYLERDIILAIEHVVRLVFGSHAGRQTMVLGERRGRRFPGSTGTKQREPKIRAAQRFRAGRSRQDEDDNGRGFTSTTSLAAIFFTGENHVGGRTMRDTQRTESTYYI